MGLDADWIGAIAGVLAAVPILTGAAVAAYRWIRRRSRPSPAAVAAPRSVDGPYDAFISHALADTALADRLIADLRDQHGLRVFNPHRDIQPGQVRVIRRGEGLLSSANGAVLFSAAAASDESVLDDYAALIENAQQREVVRWFVPVRVDDTPLPPLAGIREPVDLRREADYAQQVARLAQTLRPAGPPASAA